MPTKITAILAAKPGKEGELEALLHGMIVSSRQEPGNLRYDLWRETDGARRFVLDELYADDEAVAAHRQSPHFQNYLSVIGDLAERTAVISHPLNIE